MKKEDISRHIHRRINKEINHLKNEFSNSKLDIGYFYIDNLLPESLAKQCYEVFPTKNRMHKLSSLREKKYVSAQMDEHHKLLESVIYAFQDKTVVNLIGQICGIKSIQADESLYAGGISLMDKGSFLNPHLDNSHDADRNRWRVLNLLYYVSPDWHASNGGHLELWPNGPKDKPIVIESKFNRLVVMATHNKSWHSVSPVIVDETRCCISNYYFSDSPLKTSNKFHVTKYRARPDAPLTNLILKCDDTIRTLVRKVFKKGIRKNPHHYKKKDS